MDKKQIEKKKNRPVYRLINNEKIEISKTKFIEVSIKTMKGSDEEIVMLSKGFMMKGGACRHTHTLGFKKDPRIIELLVLSLQKLL